MARVDHIILQAAMGGGPSDCMIYANNSKHLSYFGINASTTSLNFILSRVEYERDFITSGPGIARKPTRFTNEVY